MLRAAAARGGECNQQNVLNDVMPELIPIYASQSQVIPQFSKLEDLMRQHNKAMREPSASQTVKKNILDNILTDDVKADAREIFKEMFGIDHPGTQKIVNIINCIIKAFINNDLSVFRCIQMTGILLLIAFYKNQSFRIAVAGSFVGSTFYVGWISGIGQISVLGLSGCQYVFSALAACQQLISTPDQFMTQFVSLLGDNTRLVSGFIGSLQGAIDTPSIFTGLVAQGYVGLLERMYSAGAPPPPGEGAGVAPPPGAGHLHDLRAALHAEIFRRQAIREDVTQLEAALVLLNQHAAAAAAAAAAPVPPLDPAAAAAAPVPPLAPAPVAAANNRVFNEMYNELISAGGVYGDYVKTYIISLYRYLNQVKRVFPGVVGPPGTDFLSYSCNVFNDRIIQVFGIISAQFARAGINERQTILATLLEFILPSNLRRFIFEGDDFSASKEMGIIAFRLKPSIIECLAVTENITLEAAKLAVEGCSILFTPTVTIDNVDSFVSSMPHVILERLLLPNKGDESSGESQDSQTAQPPMTPERERLSTVNDDMLQIFRKYPNTFFSNEEHKNIDRRFGTGFKAAFIKLLNAQPSVAIASVAEFAACSFMHNVIGGDITSFEPVAATKLLSAAHLKFLPLEQLFSKTWMGLFTVVTEITEANPELNSYEIIKRVQASLGFGEDDTETFNKYVRSALIGFKLSCLWNPARCTFTPAIVFVKGTRTPMAVMVLDIESTTTEVHPETQMINTKYTFPITFFESGGVSVSQGVVTKAASALEAVTQPVMAFTGALNFVMNGAMSIGRRFLPCRTPLTDAESDKFIQKEAVNAEKLAKKLAEEIAKDLPRQSDAESQSSMGETAESQSSMGEPLILTPDHEAAINNILQNSQPVISGMIDRDALAALSERFQWSREPNTESSDRMGDVSVYSLQNFEVGNATLAAAAEASQAAPFQLLTVPGLKAMRDGPDAKNPKKNKFGGNSRRRKPATAKRTRRKVYNNKSNKNKRNSRKQPSRRRRSTRRK